MLTNIITNLDKIITEVTTKITPHNIRKGVTIFGTEGSLEEIITQEKQIYPSVYQQNIVPDIDVNGIHEAIVHPVTYTIDRDIVSGNIRHSANILNVQGILSDLSYEDYLACIRIENQLLGFENYVVGKRLTLTEGEVSNDNLITTGTVENGILRIS